MIEKPLKVKEKGKEKKKKDGPPKLENPVPMIINFPNSERTQAK